MWPRFQPTTVNANPRCLHGPGWPRHAANGTPQRRPSGGAHTTPAQPPRHCYILTAGDCAPCASRPPTDPHLTNLLLAPAAPASLRAAPALRLCPPCPPLDPARPTPPPCPVPPHPRVSLAQAGLLALPLTHPAPPHPRTPCHAAPHLRVPLLLSSAVPRPFPVNILPHVPRASPPARPAASGWTPCRPPPAAPPPAASRAPPAEQPGPQRAARSNEGGNRSKINQVRAERSVAADKDAK